MAEVILSKVEKTYPNGFKAVHGIDLHINDKEFIVLVGPSGCGKSTSLRMVAGLEEITGGTIAIGDRVINNVAPKDRNIAMVFQNYALYPHMTVYKNMAFGLKLRKMPKTEIDQKVREAAKILGIEDLLERKPKALSGGQRQRVAVGRAIVRDPACFLFDEPLSNLDAKLRVETRAELKRLHQKLQTTTIYVTHDQEEAMTLGDRVVVMSNGLIQQCDAPLTIYSMPKNRFVGNFVGMPPMNFVEGQAIQDNGQTYFTSDGIKVLLEGRHADGVQGKIGQDVVLGIRPEALHLRQSEVANNPEQTVNITLRVVEPLGSQMDLYTEMTSGQGLVSRVDAEPVTTGTEHEMFIEMDKVHVFETGDYGVNLSLVEEAVAV